MTKKTDSNSEDHHRFIAEARREQAAREKGYRARALKMYPWVCGHCARSFTRKNLRELEVHHRDHNHDNNPPDGSNWELLCMYCHENQHARHGLPTYYSDEPAVEPAAEDVSTHQPFSVLADLLKKKEK